jgi:outer membrane protein
MSEEINLPIDQQRVEYQDVKNSMNNKEKPVAGKITSLLLIFNIVLFIGLVVLYILFFFPRSGNPGSLNKALEKARTGSISVAFVNNDSILDNYELVKQMRTDLEAKYKRLGNELNNRQNRFEQDYAYFQEQVNKKSISDKSAQEIYGQLMQERNNIADQSKRYETELQQSEMDMNVAYMDSVMNFLQRYNQLYKFDYILGLTKGGNILLANDTLDITNDVLKNLNKEYFDKHGKK